MLVRSICEREPAVDLRAMTALATPTAPPDSGGVVHDVSELLIGDPALERVADKVLAAVTSNPEKISQIGPVNMGGVS